MLLKCGDGENCWEFLGLQGDQTSQSWRKSVLNIQWKDWCSNWNSNILATRCEEPTLWKRHWCWKRWKATGQGYIAFYKESWALKKRCFWTVVLEKTLESSLDCKEIQQVHPKGNQSWIFIGRTDAESETTILWPPAAKNWLIWKDPDAGRDWRGEEKGTTEDAMVGWHHWLINVWDSRGSISRS